MLHLAMAVHGMYFWKQTPLFRLLVPFILGIIFQWYIGIGLTIQILIASCCIVLFGFINWLPQHKIFTWGWLRGIAIMVFLFVAAAFITYKNDIRNNDLWVGNLYKNEGAVIATVQEPLVEKSKSYKALAVIDAIYTNNKWIKVKGNLLLYFKKDSLPPALTYGSQIVFIKALQPITNPGNPGSFNYQRFNAFRDIYHQCFLQTGDYKTTGVVSKNAFRQWLFDLQFSVINALKKYIKEEREQGVAEALLIGYRDDLDKNLVQAYSNTGVVHIIAISGLHLGMIYGTLVWFFKLFKKRKWLWWIKPLVILLVIWIFSLIAGAAPSILRSAVMFTFILAGESLAKKLTIYNTLAASAFTLLCFNPFALWDVGFQLSYAAVLSIVLFMQPVYNWFYFKNKFLRAVWKLNAVTLSAQILTVPIVCYH
ncbi:MAG: ComEC family competence protein, partial [Chitinophagaceae bacterium]|nr:ComEC family competence protein [Chitinophagaceae bacterium]